MNNDNKALVALMDLVLAIADYVTTPPGHRSESSDRVRDAKWAVKALRLGDCDRQERATRQPWEYQALGDGKAAKAAVEATVRRWEAYVEKRRRIDPIEADDSRVTDGHQCCGGKPDCGCRSVGG